MTSQPSQAAPSPPPEPLSMAAVLRIPTMRRLWYAALVASDFTAQISGLILSGLLANRIGVRHVFGLCAILLALLIVIGRLWMEPEHTPAATA